MQPTEHSASADSFAPRLEVRLVVLYGDGGDDAVVVEAPSG